jgi:hypothetical protein
MLCGACGTENGEGARFCSACGTALVAQSHELPSAGPVLAEARPILERLRAAPSLERVAALEAAGTEASASTGSY